MNEFEEFKIKRRTIKENVEEILQRFPSARNDYRMLLQLYWYHFDDLKRFIPFEELRKMTQPESITRAFREIANIQKRKELQPTEIVQEARAIERENYTDYFREKKKQAVFENG